MFDHEYENPMVIGDYGEEDQPTHNVRCPQCGRVWNGYEYEDEIEWECDDDSYTGSMLWPTSKHGCKICAWERRTVEQLRAYVEDRTLYVEVLEYLLCARKCSINHYDDAKALWDLLVETEDADIKDWMNELIGDYVHDKAKSDFVEWVMEGGVGT